MLIEDFDFISTDDFAVTASASIAGVVTSVDVIFDDEYTPMGIDAEGRQITAYCKSSAIAGIAHRDTLTLSQTLYEIVGVHPEGDGCYTELLLKNRGRVTTAAGQPIGLLLALTAA